MTKKPPKILIAEMMIAKKLMMAIRLISLQLPRAIMAPIIITPEMALVTDIRAVCNAGVTFQTTK